MGLAGEWGEGKEGGGVREACVHTILNRTKQQQKRTHIHTRKQKPKPKTTATTRTKRSRPLKQKYQECLLAAVASFDCAGNFFFTVLLRI